MHNAPEQRPGRYRGTHRQGRVPYRVSPSVPVRRRLGDWSQLRTFRADVEWGGVR